jgi:hypothetical protein
MYVVMARLVGGSRWRLVLGLAVLVAISVLLPVGQAEARQVGAYMLRIPDGGTTYQLMSCQVVPAPGSSSIDPVQPVINGDTGALLHGLASTPDGRLIGIDGAREVLVEVDRWTGATTDLVALDHGAGPLASLDLDASGQLWMADDHDLFRIDTATGAVTHVVQADRLLESFAVHQGRLLASEGSELLELDPDTGATTILASFQGPFWYCTVMALASDGAELWGVLPCASSPPTPANQPYPLVRFDLASGSYDTVVWLDNSGGDDPPTAMALLGTLADVPALGPIGATLLALAIAALAVVAIRFRMA